MARRFAATIARLTLIMTMFFPHVSYAYIDPGTGSYLLQMLIAGILASAFAIKMTWQNIKKYLSNWKETKNPENDSH